jgi:uncharacterized membrane protein
MQFFHPHTAFDKAFLIGIILKGLDGFLELVGGLLLLFVSPSHISHIVTLLTRGELNENPHDLIATHLIHWSSNLTKGTLIFGGIYLLAHGLAKLVLVFEILRDHLWAYIGLIVITTLFIGYQSYEIIYSHSISLSLLTIFDVVVVYLTVKEYKKQRRSRMGSATQP